MIHVVTIRNQHLYARQLDQMFRMRHVFYVEERGWTDLVSEDGRETDKYDNEYAVYLMKLDRFGDIEACFRLNPTIHPYLLADELPEFLDGQEAPRTDEVWDLTRWMVAPSSRREEAGKLADAQRYLICGVMEFAESRGILKYTVLTDTVFLKRIEKVWPIQPIGRPRFFEDGKQEAIAAFIEAGPHVLAKSRDITGIYSPILFELNPEPPKSSLDRNLRERSMQSHTTISQDKLQSIRTAADLMINELKNFQRDDIEASIQTIESFTDYIRSVADLDTRSAN